MTTIRARLASLERDRGTSSGDDMRAIVEAMNRAVDDPDYVAIVDDLRMAACRADTDRTLPRQAALAIPTDGPSAEDCERRLMEWFERRHEV